MIFIFSPRYEKFMNSKTYVTLLYNLKQKSLERLLGIVIRLDSFLGIKIT